MVTTVQGTALYQQQARENAMVAEGRKRWAKRQRLMEKRGEASKTDAGKAMLPLVLPAVAENLRNLLAEAVEKRGVRPEWVEPLQSCDLDMLAADAVRVSFDAIGAETAYHRWVINCGQALWDCALVSAIQNAEDKALKKSAAAIAKGDGNTRHRRRALNKAADKAGLSKPEWIGKLEALAAEDSSGPLHLALTKLGEVVANAVLLTELFERYDLYENAHSTVRLGLTEMGLVFAAEIDADAQYVQPMFSPMLKAPRPWRDFNTGCYYDDRLSRHVPLVRTHDREQKRMIKDAIRSGRMGEFMRCLDILGSVRFVLDADGVDFVVWLWESREGEKVEGFPTQEQIEVPQNPDNWDDLTGKEKNRFIGAARMVHRFNRGIPCNVVQMKQDIATMRDLLKHEGFYQPHNTDFRGRVYPVAPFNHQRSDHIKGLFKFAQAKRLGDRGLFWLKVHAANCADLKTAAGVKLSKLPFADRVKWVDDNRDLITAVGTDPRGNLDTLTKADAPIGFYVVCKELAQAWALDNPADFCSSVPVGMDGSNSGVQHYAAALRALEGRFVNLLPGDKPEDLYAEVARTVLQVARDESRPEMALPGDPRTMIAEWAEQARAFREQEKADRAALAQLKKDAKAAANEGDKDAAADMDAQAVEMAALIERVYPKDVLHHTERYRDIAAARLWLAHGIDRSTVKRNVMTFGYSSKTGGFRDQLVQDFMNPLELNRLKALSRLAKAAQEGQEPAAEDVAAAVHPFGTDAGAAAAGWLAARCYAAVTATLPATAAGMRYFQAASSVLAHEAKPTIWTTPLGLPVVHKYCDWDTKEVHICLFDRSVPVWEKTKQDKVTGDDSVLKRYRSEVAIKQKDVINKDKARSAVAPNVIHGQDAAHLMLLTLAAYDAGIVDQMHIHDCFACHAANMEEFFHIIRDAFVKMYERFDLFAEFDALTKAALSEEGRERLRANEAGALPVRGDLDLSLVRESAFAFA